MVTSLGFTLGLPSGHFKVNLGSLQENSRVHLGILWDHFRGTFGVTLGVGLGHFTGFLGITFGVPWSHFEHILGSPRGYSRVTLEIPWDIFGGTFGVTLDVFLGNF